MSTLTITVPALRDRAEDIDLLAEHFVKVFNERFGVRRVLGPRALAVLHQHSWPGNVRELRHVIEAAMVVCDGDELLPEHFDTLPAAARGGAAGNGSAEGTPTLRHLERAHIAHVLEATGGHRSHAAKLLGISERNLYRKIRAHHLDA